MDYRSGNWCGWRFISCTGLEMHFGIDFGAKLAGTTALCYDTSFELVIIQTTKKQDADLFCSEWIEKLSPEFVMIDAPLSLPKAYHGQGDDFFYRDCDRQLQAMSPMFLGGLTARAMRLAKFWAKSGKIFYEAYPRMVETVIPESRRDKSNALYCDDIVAFIRKETELEIKFMQNSKHSCDALLAWFAGYRKSKGIAHKTGEISEGLIWY